MDSENLSTLREKEKESVGFMLLTSVQQRRPPVVQSGVNVVEAFCSE